MDTNDLRIRRWGSVGDGYLGPAFHMRFKPDMSYMIQTNLPTKGRPFRIRGHHGQYDVRS